jgi:hypothetical protein
LALVALAWFSLSPANRALGGTIVYNARVDTSSLAGSSGIIDFQFNPGGVGTLPATLTISNFISDATLTTSLVGRDGDATGTLPGPLTLNNTFQLNDIFQSLVYGTSLAFTVTFSGQGVDTPDPLAPGSVFALSLSDGNFNPLLTTDPAGSVLTIDLNPDGSTTATTFPQSSTNPMPAATAQLVPPPVVPEPPVWALLLTGVSGLGLSCRPGARRRGLSLR